MEIHDRVSNYMALLNDGESTSANRPLEISESNPSSESSTVAVALSAKAVQLAEDSARRERLDMIRQQLAAGSYNISGKDVAEKMLTILKG